MSKVQESAKQIMTLLPGVDCGGFGGCGYSTCEECAVAIAEGASVAQCPACNSDAVAAIAEIMGVDAVEVEDKTAFIKCSGDAAGKARFAGMSSCNEAKESGFLDTECKWGCIGLGSCTQRCEFGAMELKDGKVVINKEKCTGCMACVSACPQKLISMVPKDASNFIPCSSKENEKKTFETCGFGCIGCGDCALACPKGAITMVMGDKVDGRYAAIDYSKCEGCVTCTVKCRKKIIVDTYHDLTKVKEEVAFVKCVGGISGNKKLKAVGIEDCAEAEKLDLKSMGICEHSCTGMGNCTKACRFDAISVKSGVALVDADKCVGCGDCMRACPRNMIIMAPYKGAKQMACSSTAPAEERMKVCKVGCIACGDCADNCPNGAISMVNGNPQINDELCENCGVCTYVCSRRLISERKVPEYNYMQINAMKIDSQDNTDERM